MHELINAIAAILQEQLGTIYDIRPASPFIDVYYRGNELCSFAIEDDGCVTCWHTHGYHEVVLADPNCFQWLHELIGLLTKQYDEDVVDAQMQKQALATLKCLI